MSEAHRKRQEAEGALWKRPDVMAANDHWRTDAITPEELVLLAQTELRGALMALPPDCGDAEDAFHAGCCVLRAHAVLLKLSQKLASAARDKGAP